MVNVTIATIALYIVVIMAVLTLSTKFMWAFFIVFTYRTLSLLIPYEWFYTHIAQIDHIVYFICLLIISLGLYLALMRFTFDFQWLRIIILIVLGFITLRNFDILDVFLLKDYLESIGLWGFEAYVEQFKEIFRMGPSGFVELLEMIVGDVVDGFSRVFGGLSDFVN